MAKRGEAHDSGLGAYRYVVERTFAWFKGFRRLRLRYERTAFMHEAVLSVAVCVVCFRHLQTNSKHLCVLDHPSFNIFPIIEPLI